MMTTKTTESTQWIEENMLGYYPEEFLQGRSLTEAEVRFQYCTEQLPVPDWYCDYRKPSSRKTLASDGSKSNSTGSPKKKRSPSKNTAENTAKKAQQDAEPPRTSSADSGFGDTFCHSPRTLKISSIGASKSSFAPCSTSSPAPPASNASVSDVFESPKSSKNNVRDELNDSLRSVARVRRCLNTSNTFPRISPSRKIKNINLVFSKPFPTEPEPLIFEDVSNAHFKRTNAVGLVQSIINELDRSSGGCLLTGNTSGSPSIANSSMKTYTISEARGTFVRSMVEALEQANNNASGASNISYATYIVHPEEEDVQSDDSTDSELAKSTSISVESCDSTVTPLYSACIAIVDSQAEEEESESDEGVHWAPCTLLELPRPGSRLSIASSIFGTEARGVSPKPEQPEDWLQAPQQMQQTTKAWNLAGRSNERSSSRRLSRIDETDFRYSDAFVSATPIFV